MKKNVKRTPLKLVRTIVVDNLNVVSGGSDFTQGNLRGCFSKSDCPPPP